MAVFTVDDTILQSPEAAEYFRSPGTDRRVKTGFRLALEWLGIPIPDYARRGEVGRYMAARSLTDAFNADHGIRSHSKHLHGTIVADAARNGWQGPA